MTKLKYILIDPFTESVTSGVFSYESSKLKLRKLYQLIGCDYVDKVTFDDDSHDIIVDDEGLYHTPDGVRPKYFTLHKFAANRLLAGRGVIVRVLEDRYGAGWGSASVSLDEIKESVVFYDQRSALIEAARFEEEEEEPCGAENLIAEYQKLKEENEILKATRMDEA